MRFGLALPQFGFSMPGGRAATVADAVHWAREAERLGFGSVWLADHLFFSLEKYGGPATRYSAIEPLAALGAVASATEHVRVGSLVLCNPFRHPAVLAGQAATLRDLSGGRFILGLGAGWYEPEFTASGIPFGSVGSRIGALEESLQIVRGLFGEEPFTFKGEHYVIDDAPPQPGACPPILVGSKGGPRMLGIIARHADGWNVAWRATPPGYAATNAALDAACERAGRDPRAVRRTVGQIVVIGEDERDLASRWRTMQEWSPGGLADAVSPSDWATDALIGTPSRIRERVAELEAAGAGDIICTFGSLPFAIADSEQIEMFAEHVIRA